MPKLKHLTDPEREQLRAALEVGVVRAKAGIAMAERGTSVSRSTQVTISGGMTARFEATTDGPADAIPALQAVQDNIAGCLGSMAMDITFDVLVARSGDAVGANVVGAGSHEACVEDNLRAVKLPAASAGYSVHGKIVYK